MAIILASTSSIRRRLLENAGVAFTSEKPPVNEGELKSLSPTLGPEAMAQHLAAAKCMSVSARHPDDFVIGADQVLSFAGKTYDKPENLAEAKSHLLEFSGKTHTLISAVCCARGGAVLWHYSDRAELTMRPFSDRFLENYLAAVGGDATTSVGAYKLEGPGIQLFEGIKGDYFTILGLPLLPLLAFLRSVDGIGR
ncbi:MAG: Maf family protein [Rhizobiales bacterium]|nr:Maf family protein [Hyphomicrobiales bacterium]